MKKVPNNQNGFSLTEMLIATGIMAIGLVLIATVFPVGVQLTGLSAERSVAAVVADEAFAKVRLYGLCDFADWPAALIDANKTTPVYTDLREAAYHFCDLFKYTTKVEVFSGPDGLWETDDDRFISPGANRIYESSAVGDTSTGGDDVLIYLGEELIYPSAVVSAADKQRYHWSALCRRTDLQDVEVTVFVTHKTFSGMNYYTYPYDSTIPAYVPANTATWPVPVKVNVQYNAAKPRELVILSADADNESFDDIDGEDGDTVAATVFKFFDAGYTIVNDRDGRIYRILEMKDALPLPDGDYINDTIVLYRDWEPDPTATVETVWVVPPGVGSDRYPCVGVFQKVLHFDDVN